MFLLLTCSLLFTQKPDIDEGWFVNPAWSLASRGFMGTTAVQESTFKGGRDLTGMNRRTYWIMPLQPVAESVWFRLVGVGVPQMRFWSVAWGLVALLCWWRIARSLLASELLAMVATAMIAVDYTFVRVAAQGRMDMMCAALGLLGVGLYLEFRERSLSVAIFAASCAVTASLFTHPNGILYLFAILICAASLDIGRLGPRHLALAALPFLVAAASWGLYILEAPDLFRRQFAGNAAGRLSGLADPVGSLISEVRDRYLGLGSGKKHLLKIATVLPYLLGLFGAVAVGAVRRRPGCRILILWAISCFLYFWLFESTRLFLYVVHIAPIFLALLVAVVASLVTDGVFPDWVPPVAVASFLAVQLAGCALVARSNTMAEFAEVEHFLEPQIQRGALVMGSAELGIPLGYPDNFLDDQRLGCQTGRRPDLIVIGTRYTSWFQWAAVNEPETYACIQRLVTQDYQTVLLADGIEIKQRR